MTPWRSYLLLPVAVLIINVTMASAYTRSYIEDNNRAYQLVQEGDYFAAAELLQRSLDSSLNNATIRKNLLATYQTGGHHYLQQRRYHDVVRLLTDALEFDDSHRAFWSTRGFALLQLGEYYDAEADLLEARRMGEPDSSILLMLGKLYYDTDRMYEAQDVLERALLHTANDAAIEAMLDKVKRELAVESEMDKEYGGHFVITFDGEQNDALGTDVLEVLEEAYNWIGSQLDHYPQERVTVILYSRQQFSDLTNSPEWASGLYDGKIRLPVGGVSRIDDEIRGLLYHEYMHVVLRDIAGSNLPYWLNEGLAEVVESRFGLPNLELLRLARQRGQLFDLPMLEGAFDRFRGAQVILAYQQSYSFVQYLLDNYGWHMVRDLLFALGSGQPIARAVEEAYGVYGLTYAQLEKKWREE